MDRHYAVTKFILGCYLVHHFATWDESQIQELFGANMVYTNLYQIVPTLPITYDLIMILVLAFLLADRLGSPLISAITSGVMYLLWSYLTNRNLFIANPGIPYVGWLLLVYTVAPYLSTANKWNVYYIAWFLMALGYTVSGLHKLQCPSWVDGSALEHVLRSPLARDNIIVHGVLSMPLHYLTWASLVLEITFLPLGIFYYTRLLYWFAYLVFHLGILCTINFSDLTLGVFMIHIFTFPIDLIHQIGIKSSFKYD